MGSGAACPRLGIDADKVHVVSPYWAAHSARGNPMTPRTALIALAAMSSAGRSSSSHARPGVHHRDVSGRDPSSHSAGAARDGKLVGYSHEGWEISSRPDSYVVAGVETVRISMRSAPSDQGHVVHATATHRLMRSPPVVPYIYALEKPRWTNWPPSSALIRWSFAVQRHHDRSDRGQAFSSVLMKCYDQAADASAGSGRDPRPGSMREGDWQVGWGCASAFYPTHVGAATARVRLLPSGSAGTDAAHEIGNGVYTVLGQLAQSAGRAAIIVTVEVGDSSLPPAPVAGGSNTTASTCSAVLRRVMPSRQAVPAAVSANDGALAGHCPTAHIPGRQGGGVGRRRGELEDVFKHAGVNAIEEYAEFVPSGVRADAIKSSMPARPP